MRLLFLEPYSRAEINIRRLRRHGYDTYSLLAQSVPTVDRLVVLGDGSPEDKLVGILSCHLDGSKVVAIVKAPKSNLAALDCVKEYAKRRKIEKMLFIIDQDNLNLDRLFEIAVIRITKHGIEIQPIEMENGLDRVKAYRCRCSGKDLVVVIVASGLDAFETTKHEIEDHLLLVAGVDSSGNDPKKQWESLDQDAKDDVIRLLKDKDVCETFLPQHFCGLSYLEDCNTTREIR
jgi:hypothetical protein